MSRDAEATERMLDKLRTFQESLDAAERRAFAALVGPGVALAHSGGADVLGFAGSWQPQTLPTYVAEAIRGRDVRVEGL